MPSDIKNFDFMIVGGGPAGISTWLHLNKLNPELAAKTLLIEKARYPRDKLCGGGALGLSFDVLKRLDINLNIPSIPIHNFEFRYGEELFCHKQQNFARIVRRNEFDYALAKKAIERGLSLNEDEIFLDFSRTNNYLKVKTNKETYIVKALIGADGATSKVRTKMELLVRPRFATAIEVFSPINSQYDQEFSHNTAVIDFTSIKEGLQGYVWHFPCMIDGTPWMNHGICNIHINKKIPRPDLKNIFSRALHERNINSEPSNWLGSPISWFEEKTSLSQPNILLVGDAAGIEPLLGSGIHLSLLYGNIAAKTLQDAVHHNDFSFNDYTTQLQSNFVGKLIQKFTYFASEIYNGKMNVLDVMKKAVIAKPSSI
jgi:menaquinone-9 beta-reductase